MRDTAEFFKVLGDQARLEMLWLLFNQRELCVCEIMAALEITQSKASRHLGTLRHAGLVTVRKDGLWSYYALRPAEDQLARRQLDVLRATLASRPSAAALLAKLQASLQTGETAAARPPVERSAGGGPTRNRQGATRRQSKTASARHRRLAWKKGTRA